VCAIIDWPWTLPQVLLICSAPFEGEIQCVHIESKGLADAIYSPDGDTFVLGGKTIVSGLLEEGWEMSHLLPRSHFVKALNVSWTLE
jgi:5'-3' exonuclease